MAKVEESQAVVAAFRHYAARGSFRSLTAESAGSRTELRFTWLRDVEVRVIFDATRRTLTFVDSLDPEGPQGTIAVGS